MRPKKYHSPKRVSIIFEEEDLRWLERVAREQAKFNDANMPLSELIRETVLQTYPKPKAKQETFF